MYLLIKDTLFHWGRLTHATQDFFALIKTIYPAVLEVKPKSLKHSDVKTGTKAAFVKCTFYEYVRFVRFS
jgi:hypothetical protein